ncbi:hypothetical protein ACFFKU_10990 [Kineococcus gynurae]|uniref:Uncharacterized protein n=1 Tax=Kineococcus gynurae TaxID=452979 RepID=A0ABV5LUM0_9ACTN
MLYDVRDASTGPGRLPPRTLQLNLVTQGLATRWESMFAVLPTGVRDRIAYLSVLLGAVVSTVALVFGEIAWPGRAMPSFGGPDTSGPPLLQTAGILPYGAWILALVAVVAGRARWGRLLSAAAAGTMIVLAVARVVPHPPVFVLAPLSVAAILSTIGHPSRRPGPRGWLVFGWVLLVGLLGGMQALNSSSASLDPTTYFYRSDGLTLLVSQLLLLIAVACLVAVGAAFTGSSWLLALVVSAYPYAALLALSTAVGDLPQALLVVSGLIGIPLLVLLGLTLGRRSASGSVST